MITENLPEIVKKEILHPKLNDKDASEFRRSTTLRLISMLAVNFIGDDDRKLAIAEFGTFLREFSLTGEEVLEAYRMALKKELQNGKGETINVFPNLSLIQAGEVLNAYKEFKITSLAHTKGIEKLRKMTEKEQLKQSPEETHKEFLKSVFSEITAVNYSSDAWLLYDDMISSSRISISDEAKKRLYAMQKRKHKSAFLNDLKSTSREPLQTRMLMQDFDREYNSGKLLKSVQNKCKCIVVSNYLKKHKADFETFKAAIHG